MKLLFPLSWDHPIVLGSAIKLKKNNNSFHLTVAIKSIFSNIIT